MKNKIYHLNLLYTFLIINFTICDAQTGDWVWIKGSNVSSNPGNYGIQGITDPANNPPRLSNAFACKDLNGNFWVFGGKSTFPNVYADLWKYDPLTNNWTWMKGTQQSLWAGNYGTQGVSSPTNNPSGRYDGATWLDNLGNIWLFGGIQSAGNYYSDLWKYDITLNEWTWVKGPNTPVQPGIYGTQGIPAPANNPSARAYCTAAWTDNAGDLWLFGGNGGNLLNDLWRYNIATNQWTWMKGSQNLNPPAVYGTKGIEDSLNVPSGRSENTAWKDVNGNFWLFGGIVSNGSVGGTNQLWRFNPLTKNWTWMSGDSTQNSYPVHGILCISAVTNKPESTQEDLANWIDDYGNLWFYEGVNYSGNNGILWKYCSSNSQWTEQKFLGLANWGTIGVPGPTNSPGSRSGSSSWKDNNGNLYLFSGGTYNDLWKFTIDSSCGSCTPTVGLNEINYQSEQILVYPNPTTGNFIISFEGMIMKGNVEILNILGESVYAENIFNESKKEVNLKNIPSGIYFVKVYDGEKYYCKKIIVEHD